MAGGNLVLAALASIPGRERFLPRVLSSLRGQVDRLCVYLNGYRTVPECVAEIADDYVVDPENSGAERKFHWAAQHDGIYLSCDDDIGYPADYADTMAAAVRRWSGKAIVTAHGRTYTARSKTVHEPEPGSVGIFSARVKEGHWVNHGGTGVMAWDASVVRMPTEWPDRNLADMQVAAWAQQERVPMWLVPHRSRWFNSYAPMDPNGVYCSSRAEGHRRRNELLVRTEWNLLRVAP